MTVSEKEIVQSVIESFLSGNLTEIIMGNIDASLDALERENKEEAGVEVVRLTISDAMKLCLKNGTTKETERKLQVVTEAGDGLEVCGCWYEDRVLDYNADYGKEPCELEYADESVVRVRRLSNREFES